MQTRKNSVLGHFSRNAYVKGNDGSTRLDVDESVRVQNKKIKQKNSIYWR